MNNTQLIGRLTKDPEVRYLESGTAVSRVTIAVDRFNKNGEKSADFIPITVFGKQAENLQKYQGKGSMIGITGSIKTGSYEKDGRTNYTWEVVANGIEYLSFKGNTANEKPNDEFTEKVNAIANEAIERADKDNDYKQMGFSAVENDDITF